MPETIYCARCDDAEVETDGAICPSCVEQTNDDAAADATIRLGDLQRVWDGLDEATAHHGGLCGCPVCAVRIRFYGLVRSVEHPGWDSLMADGWREKGITPWDYREVSPC